jgi:hypothetical protein
MLVAVRHLIAEITILGKGFLPIIYLPCPLLLLPLPLPKEEIRPLFIPLSGGHFHPLLLLDFVHLPGLHANGVQSRYF